jgi:phosphatidylserine/phosphatidylglycerophosphate/cardiolipin synthase-like enzyme
MANTDPDHWFLPAGDIPRSPHYTSDNEVLALPEGETYFSHLAARLAATKPGAYVHIAGYRVTPAIPLEPAAAPPGPLLSAELAALVARGVVVRVAVWYLPTSVAYFLYNLLPLKRLQHHKDNVEIVLAVNSAASKVKTASFAILDQRLVYESPSWPVTFASHHQKTVMVESDGHHWAYVGSVDLAIDRWDTALHASPPQRPREYHEAYHDIQCVVRGAATVQIRENFQQRWNDPKPPATPPSPLPIVRPPPIPGNPDPVVTPYGTQHVQVLRTLACRGVYSFAPRGEQTPRRALERIIDKAEHFIYIEEQFVWPCSLVTALARAVARNSGLKIIIVVARDLEFTGALGVAHFEMRRDAIAEIKGRSSGQVLVYHLEQLARRTPIYVHSKLMIVDDRFAGIGSVNVNKRSLSTDSELHLGIVDAQIDNGTIGGNAARVCRFAKSLRVRLWSEHLGLDPKLMDDPVAAVAHWPDWSKSTERAPLRVHHAVCHYPRPPNTTLLDWAEVLKALRGIVKVPPTLAGVLDLDDLIATLEAADQRLIRVASNGVVELVLGPKLAFLKQLLKDHVMNIDTTC